MPEQMGLFESLEGTPQKDTAQELEKKRQSVVKTSQKGVEDIEAFKSFTIELEERKEMEIPKGGEGPLIEEGDPEQIAERLLAEASRNPMPVFTSVIPAKV